MSEEKIEKIRIPRFRPKKNIPSTNPSQEATTNERGIPKRRRTAETISKPNEINKETNTVKVFAKVQTNIRNSNANKSKDWFTECVPYIMPNKARSFFENV